MSDLARLFADERRSDVPAAERQAMSREILAHVLASVGSQEIAAAGDVLDWAGGEFAKGVALQPEILPQDHPERGGYRAHQERRRAVLYVSELGGVGSFVNADPWAERQVLHGGFEFLRGMAQNLDIVQAIIATRVHQSTPYFRRYREDDANPTGYRWIRDDGEKLSKADLKEVDRLDAILQNCGTDTDPITRRYRSRRRTFRGFMEALIADSLTFDACPIETERANNGNLIGWRNIDATIVRLAFEDGYEGDDQIVAVQITPMDRQAIVGFEADEIVYEVRNPRSSIYAQDYGESELESLLRAMTLYLHVNTFNAASLDRNTVPRGILTLHGKYTQPQLLDFQSKWQALLNGAARRFKIPVLTSPSKAEGGATWTKLDEIQTEQTKWLLVYVASMACARYCMAPEVINIESFSAGKSSLAGSDTQEKLQSSHDKGLVPLLDWCFDGIVNPYLIHQLSPKYRIVPVGLIPQDEARKHERQKLTLTIDELRQIDGGDPHPDAVIGAAPANPALMAIYMQQNGLQPEQTADEQGADDPDGSGDRLAENLPPGERPLSTVRPPSADREQPSARPNGVAAARPKPAAVAGGRQLAKARTDAPKLVVEIRDLGPADGWPDGMG